jgi:hypothetical protein
MRVPVVPDVDSPVNETVLIKKLAGGFDEFGDLSVRMTPFIGKVNDGRANLIGAKKGQRQMTTTLVPVFAPSR